MYSPHILSGILPHLGTVCIMFTLFLQGNCNHSVVYVLTVRMNILEKGFSQLFKFIINIFNYILSATRFKENIPNLLGVILMRTKKNNLFSGPYSERACIFPGIELALENHVKDKKILGIM